MSDLKPTAGEWFVAGESAIEPDVMCGEKFIAQCLGHYDENEALANARLIAEAGTVFHETGLSPRQLAERCAELVEAIEMLMRWQVKNVDKWHNSAYDHAHRTLAKCQPKSQEGQT
jgi:hypothetical protein